MLEQLIGTTEFSPLQVGIYYCGAISWFISYILVVRRIIREKFIDYPVLAITANVVWEVLWGFAFELSFGGNYLLTLWRLGTFLDIFMFYSVLRYGKIQVSVAFLQKNYVPTMIFAAIVSTICIYTYVKTGYDLPMGINSGMILNLLMAVLSILLLWQLPNQKFSFWVGFWRFLGTDVFFTIYIFDIYSDLLFPVVLCVINFGLDTFYLYLVYQRNRTLTRQTQ